MATVTSPVPVLTEKQRERLQAVVRKATNPQRLVQRSRIVLLRASGLSISETARRLGVVRNTVRKWVRRWASRREAPIAERLADAWRPGGPARITPEQICRIIALSCDKPEHHERPITHWTQQELADEAVKQGIVDAISQRSVGRFLKSRGP